MDKAQVCSFLATIIPIMDRIDNRLPKLESVTKVLQAAEGFLCSGLIMDANETNEEVLAGKQLAEQLDGACSMEGI